MKVQLELTAEDRVYRADGMPYVGVFWMGFDEAERYLSEMRGTVLAIDDAGDESELDRLAGYVVRKAAFVQGVIPNDEDIAREKSRFKAAIARKEKKKEKK